MKKFLHADWLRACQLIPNRAESWNWVQKVEIWLTGKSQKRNSQMANQIFCFQIKRTPWDGTICGAIFPWLRDTCAFLLLNHLEVFSYILLISNQMIFLVHKLHEPYGLVQFC